MRKIVDRREHLRRALTVNTRNATCGPLVCWTWVGPTSNDGYGRLSAGRGGGLAAHRAAWEVAFGAITDGLHVLHRCDNPPCVNPSHLFLGTPLDNYIDAVEKRRRTKKLSPADVRNIRASGESPTELARRFGVTRRAIGWVKSGNLHRSIGAV